MTDLPPFLAGQAAYRAGKPITANPHPETDRIPGDSYPGDYHNWRDGWRYADGVRAHMEQQRKESK
jgi:hypothetical protein